MFVGHYGVSFPIKRSNPAIQLWFLFVAVQMLDVVWSPLVLLGIEKVRVVPGITRSNAFDLYYMPFPSSPRMALVRFGVSVNMEILWVLKNFFSGNGVATAPRIETEPIS